MRNSFDRQVREAIEIQKNKSGPKEGGINLDEGNYVKSKFWIPMLREITKEEEKSKKNLKKKSVKERKQQRVEPNTTNLPS